MILKGVRMCVNVDRREWTESSSAAAAVIAVSVKVLFIVLSQIKIKWSKDDRFCCSKKNTK